MTRNKATAPLSLTRQPGVREYQVLCLLALAVVFLIDIQNGHLPLSLLMLMVGLLSVVSRLRLGPVLFVAVFAGSQLLKQFGSRRLGIIWQGPGPDANVRNLVLGMGIIAYVTAQYRLQSLLVNILPQDPRRRSGPRQWLVLPPRIVSRKRPAAHVSPTEVGWFLLLLPVWAFLGLAAWGVISPQRNLAGLPPWSGRLIVAMWSLGLGILAAAALLRIWRQRQNPPHLATLYLQDVLWRETRREQRRLNRWLAWTRLKRPATPEKGNP